MSTRRAREERLKAWRSFRGIAKSARTLAAIQVMTWSGRVRQVARHLAWAQALADHVGLSTSGSRRVGLAIGTDMGLCGRLNTALAEALAQSTVATRPLIIVGLRLADEIEQLTSEVVMQAAASLEAVETRSAEIAASFEAIAPAQELVLAIVLAASTSGDGGPVIEIWEDSSAKDSVSAPEFAAAQAALHWPSVDYGDANESRETIARMYLRARIAHALCVAAASESSARLFTMSRAFDASERSIAHQAMDLRKLSQETTTQEMLEVRRASGRRGV